MSDGAEVPTSGPRAREAILEATRSCLRERGYPGMTIEGIAEAAGVAKTTIYRWWPGKPQLVSDALSGALVVTDIPDLDDTRTEIALAVRATIESHRSELFSLALPVLTTRPTGDADVAAQWRDTHESSRRRTVASVLERAIARGDLPPDLDTDLVQDVWAGVVVYRCFLSDGPVDDDLADALVGLVMDGAPALRRRTR